MGNAILFCINMVFTGVHYCLEAIEGAAIWIIKVGLALLIGLTLIYMLEKVPSSAYPNETTRNLPPLKLSDSSETLTQIYGPFIKLTQNGHFKCSGTVISNIYAITASHCVSTPSGHMDRSDIGIIGMGDEYTGVTANAVAMMKSQDVALIRGDFTKFKKVVLETNPGGILSAQGPFVTCGFPGGDRVICNRFTPTSNAQFLIYGTGFLYQGMSGGAVIDASTNHLVAVNSAAATTGVLVGPLIGFLTVAEVKVEE